jgi:restriction endonuclease S subunit
MDGFAGAIGVSKSKGKMSPVAHIYEPRVQLDVRFYAYYLRHLAHVGYIQSLAKGIRERSTSFDPSIFAEVDLPLPTIAEQKQIADFLDDKLSVLTTLMDANKRLIMLNSQFLSTSIDREFKTTASTEIEVRRVVKYSSKKRNDLLPTLSLDLVNAKRGTLNVESLPITNGETSTLMKSGDVCFGKLRPYLGKVYLANEPTFAESEFIVMTPNQNLLDSRYFRNYLLTRRALDELESKSVGAKMPRTSWDQIASLRLPLPSLHQQLEICEKISKLEDRAKIKENCLRQMIDKIDEYTHSLVSGTVTGTFDISAGRSVA